MIRRPPRSTLSSSSAASDVYKRQLLFRAKDGFYLSYNKKVKNSWEMDGLILLFWYFKFGDVWYSEKQCNKGALYKNPQTYDRSKDIKRLRNADKCFWGGSNLKDRCSKEFIITKLPAGKLTQMTELHSLEQKYIDHDFFNLFFDIYVR
eukprot:TRINITY_DN481_c0_g1_i1.p1 TRINITY_DN481_c0_g1~~TRINITY_DN481_c0_g1_i1.p1  ORF type:complete len:149 (-),score=32.53 TRINITY_DN481_c0_g1_i1:49-495(-)